MVIRFICSTLFLFVLIHTCHASDYCADMKLGWHFYCDPQKAIEEEEAHSRLSQMQSAKAELKQIQERLEDLKVQAIMHPTESNLKSYIAYQKEQLDRASKFSDVWSKVLWSNPEIDYMVKSPLSSVGNEVRYEFNKKKIKDKLIHLHDRYGLFFFYNSSCIYCQKFSPILKTFAGINNLTVIAISMDGNFLPDWPSSLINHGQAQKFGMADKPVPALMLFDNELKKVIPIGFGLLSMAELEERIHRLTEVNNG